MKLALPAFILLIACGVHANPLQPPTSLTLTWNDSLPSSTTVRPVVISWKDNALGETGYTIERKIGTATAWTTLAGSTPQLPAGPQTGNVLTYTDGTILRSVNTPTFYYYRVRARNGTQMSGPAEAVTIAIPSQWPSTNYDSDADGITDGMETAAGLNPFDWEDSTGDVDGDLVPNAWEANLGRSMTNPGMINPHVTVDSSRLDADTATHTRTIAAAISRLTTTQHASAYRIILVKPGVYVENLNITSTFQIAFIADRNDPQFKGKECEIRGAAAAPVINAIGSMVFDGFILSRSGTAGDAALSFSEAAIPMTRVSTTRMVNCIARDMNTGTTAVVEQAGGRLVLAHNTFFMNRVDDASKAPHSYTCGELSTTPIESRARLRMRNCILWNPINIKSDRPEFRSVGDYEISSNIIYAQPLLDSSNVNPGLTPKGYLMSDQSPASRGGSSGWQVLRDMHGEIRYNPPGRGADDWNDVDSDLIPDFWDTNMLSVANAQADLDADGNTELDEYRAGTTLSSADSEYLTLEQALRLFTMPEAYLTRQQADALYLPINPTTPRKLLVQPGGGISMGEFQ